TSLTVSGSTADSGSTISSVQVSVDNGPYVSAQQVGSNSWNSWSASVNLGTQGLHTVSSKATDNAGNAATTSVSFTLQTSALYDDFSGSGYSLSDGQTSPNGKWYNHYTGYGSAGVSNQVFVQQPAASTTTGITHSVLTTSTSSYHNYKLSVDMRTDKQLRTGSSPNSWETAWIMFNYVDNYHHYYFVLKTSGAELGKKDNNLQQDAQIFLSTPSTPKVTIGQWQHIDVTVQNNVITVYVNGNQVSSVTDATQSALLGAGGKIGLYCEDSAVSFDNVSITPLT